MAAMRELVWKNTVSVLATRPCWRSFFAERVAWAVTACASTSNGVMGVPEDRVTALPLFLHRVGMIVGLVAGGIAGRVGAVSHLATRSLGAGVSLAGIALVLS